MPPLVSVIIPIYNMESFLAETLQSVLASTYPHFEVILVDDGSTDRSVNIAQSFVDNDHRVHLFRQENAGPCRARNRAVKESKGKYIFPHDADDLLAPHFLSDAVAVLEAQSEVKLVCPTIEFIGARKGIWQLPTFDRNLLARRRTESIIHNAMLHNRNWSETAPLSILANLTWRFSAGRKKVSQERIQDNNMDKYRL